MKRLAFTLDLESDYSGVLADHYGVFRNRAAIEELLSELDRMEVKLTVFCVGQVLERFPDVVRIFEYYKSEFQVHSYSHNLKEPDSELEVMKAKSAYFAYFGRNPTAYRAPQGRISKEGLKRLEQHGFLYDSSIFPSYFPSPFRYLFSKRRIHRVHHAKLVEIPIASVTPFRLTLSASFVNLLSFPFYKTLFRLFPAPDDIVYASHLHDLIFCEDSYCQLPFYWRWIYHRNKHDGLGQTVRLLTYLREKGYRFCYMSELYESFLQRMELERLA